MADISKIKLPNNTTYDINAATVNGHTVDKNVPSNAVFTDTNTKVTQISATNVNSDFRLLLSGKANDTNDTNTSNKSNKFIANPSTGNMTIGGQLTDAYGLQSIRSLTQAQYDALTTAEKNNGRFIITDADAPTNTAIWDKIGEDELDVGADLSDAVNILNGISEYSTTEQAVGKWIDGKTLYRKVYTCPSFSVTSSSTTQIHTVFTFPSNTNIIKYFCVLNHSTSEYMLPYANGNKTSSCVGIKDTTPYIQLRVANDGWTSVTVTTEAYYTKNS